MSITGPGMRHPLVLNYMVALRRLPNDAAANNRCHLPAAKLASVERRVTALGLRLVHGKSPPAAGIGNGYVGHSNDSQPALSTPDRILRLAGGHFRPAHQ